MTASGTSPDIRLQQLRRRLMLSDRKENPVSATCQVPGCGRPVSRDGFELCHTCWKDRDQLRKVNGNWVRPASSELHDDEADPAATHGEVLSSTKIGNAIGLTNQRVNLVLAELGWIEKFIKGWKVTSQGERVGGVTRTSQKGIPYVVWPVTILKNRVFRGSGTEEPRQPDEDPLPTTSQDRAAPAVEDGRLKFPAKYRTTDGHYVRSRADDNLARLLIKFGVDCT